MRLKMFNARKKQLKCEILSKPRNSGQIMSNILFNIPRWNLNQEARNELKKKLIFQESAKRVKSQLGLGEGEKVNRDIIV